MSRFFGFSEKINEESIARQAKDGDSSEAPRLLSVLHPLQNGDSQAAEQVLQFRQAAIDEVHLTPESRLIFQTDPRSPAADRFRYLRMRLRMLKATGKLKSLLIASALPQDGKSTVALNLATVLAEGGKQSVLLIEADLYHHSLSEKLGLPPKRPGLAECLEGSMEPVSAVRRLEPVHWYLLPAGTAQGNATELLQSDSFPRVLQKLSPYFDWILIDSPPIAPLTDALLISQHVDTALLVVRADRTPRDVVEEALRLLGPEKVLGILFNGVENLNRLYSQYVGYYGKKTY
jgi:capsular exopolysaccharide synthesis family protein